MYNLKSAAVISVLGACLVMGASANAAEPGNLRGCVASAKDVQAALDANQQSPNHDAAVKEQHNGRDFCGTGLYQQGVNHYAQALKLLGADKT